MSCLFTPQREILSVALAPKQGLAENFELLTWSRNIKSLLTSTNTGKVTRYSSCKHKNAYLAHHMREFSLRTSQGPELSSYPYRSEAH